MSVRIADTTSHGAFDPSVNTVMKHLCLLRVQETVSQHMMFKGPRMECGRNAGANSGTAMSPRTGSLAGLLVLAICLRPLWPGAFVGSHARLAIHRLGGPRPESRFLAGSFAQLLFIGTWGTVHVGVKLVLQHVVSRGLP